VRIVRKSLPKVPATCGQCECCTPYQVPLPYHPVMGFNLSKKATVTRYYCNFDHHSAVDSKGNPSAVMPHQPPPIKSDGTPFCPKAKGYQEEIAVVKTERGRFAGHTGEEHEQAFEAFPVDEEGWRRVKRTWACNHEALIQARGRQEKIRIVTDAGSVLREIVPS
jgi:hypothetical protein